MKIQKANIFITNPKASGMFFSTCLGTLILDIPVKKESLPYKYIQVSVSACLSYKKMSVVFHANVYKFVLMNLILVVNIASSKNVELFIT